MVFFFFFFEHSLDGISNKLIKQMFHQRKIRFHLLQLTLLLILTDKLYESLSRDSLAQLLHWTSLVHVFVCSSRSRMCGFDIEVDVNTTLAFYPPDSFAIWVKWLWLGTCRETSKRSSDITRCFNQTLRVGAKDLLSQPE